ncbi:NAD(P)-binding oxidoreductase [Cytobacillus sp. IB215665]|uniref:NAD(P)-binding oxidoreductase n=1 Tax=Cytobacillus sp. IB215665 TaxID=3097357 RepID=UPI002A135C82|nr:NAD(P)-binding oxidoreductase [Cytobacillus sp. IB215665]MDX8366928.1 NAD(P)-binding oxidoreductase [Cytobacillus sp. IB215665]
MRVLVLGASGATGKQVVTQLINRQINTRILIRNSATLPKDIKEHPLVEIKKGNINDLNDSEMNNLLLNCNVIISCLGHNPTLKGMFGKPRSLVFNAIKKISDTVKDKKVKLILMSTAGYTNTLSREKNSLGEKLILSLLYWFLPPHRDNVRAANYLIRNIGEEDENIDWIAVRPDTLVNNDEESSYEVCEFPIRSPIFNAGKTSRINVSHFMAELVTDDTIWKKWAFKTPVIYNK